MAWKPTRAGPDTLRKLYHWVWKQLSDVGLLIGDEGGTTPPDPPPVPGHQHWHDNLINVTPDQHHNQQHDLGGGDHPDVSITAPEDGELLVFNGDTSDWENDPLLKVGINDNGNGFEQHTNLRWGAYLVDDYHLNQYDALIPGTFYVAADSLTAGPDSWLGMLLSNDAIDATQDAAAGRSVSRPGSKYIYAAPPASVGDIALIILGTNDQGGMDVGDGNNPSGTPADTTPAQLQADAEALIDDFVNDGYRTIWVMPPYNDLGDYSPRYDTAMDLVRQAIEDAITVKGIEKWYVQNTNLGDKLHPTIEGQRLWLSDFYPRLVAVGSDQESEKTVGESWPTGLINGGELNIGPGPNDIEVIAGNGLIVDSYTNPSDFPVVTPVAWAQINTPITAAPAAAGSLVYFTIDSAGTLHQYAAPPDEPTRRAEIFLGVVIHNGDEWGEISSPIVINNSAHTLTEFLKRVAGPTFIIDGGAVTENTSPAFSIDQAAGTVWEHNRNWHVNKADPHREALPATTTLQWRYVNRDFTDVSGLTSAVDPDQWDDGGTVSPTPGGGNACTVQQLYQDPRDNYWLLWGQHVYDNAQEAAASVAARTEVPTILQASVLLGYIVVEKGKNNWDDDEAFIVYPQGLGGVGGGGVPITKFTELADTPGDYTGFARGVPEIDDTELFLQHDYRTKAVDYVNGNTYYPQEMVFKGGYLMVANTITTDDPEPIPDGNPLWAIEDGIGVPTFSTLTAAEPVYLTGCRFTIGDSGGQLNGYRWYCPDDTGNFTFEVWQANSAGVLSQLIAPTSPGAVGWYAIPETGLLLPGIVFDLIVVGRAVTQPNTFTANWDVKNSNGNPSAGEAWFQNNNTEIRVHHEDKLGADQQGNLEAVEVGGTLQFAGETWTITAISTQGTHVRYTLSPNQGRPTEDERSLTFSWGSSAPIPYVEDIDHLLGSTSVEGFKDTAYPPAALNDNAYGVDINVEELTLSPDWDIFGLPGGSGGGSGGGLEPHVLNYHDDVTITGPVDDEVLTYEAGQWVNKAPVVGSGFWQANGDDIYNTNSDSVGIGTTTPKTNSQAAQYTTLAVKGDPGNNQGGEIVLETDAGQPTRMFNSNGNQFFSSDGTTTFRTLAGTSRLRVLTDGLVEVNSQLRVGNTTFPTAGPDTISIGCEHPIQVENIGSDSGANLVINIGGVITSQTSDARLKQDIEDIQYGLEEILRLRPVDFTWQKSGSKDSGFIAQEVLEVIPEAVPVNKDGYYGFRSDPILAALVRAVQELAEKVDGK